MFRRRRFCLDKTGLTLYHFHNNLKCMLFFSCHFFMFLLYLTFFIFPHFPLQFSKRGRPSVASTKPGMRRGVANQGTLRRQRTQSHNLQHTGCFFNCSAQNFSAKKKNVVQPTRIFCTSRTSWNRISDWLAFVFHFGTENWEEQLKKAPCIF